ncbi:MAG: hypothetical protein JO297_07240 [Nitrososphaeraceae archaeon]|nr:hypothetical protein [Nitrososphaeraceae archaeon]
MMNKSISFAISAVVLLATIVAVALYSVDTANAQGNATSAGGAVKNMTGGAGGALKNMTGGAGGALKSAMGGK